MADPITFQAALDTFACGKDFTNITVVNFRGPAGSKICAYSCNMNVDLDGEPQAYGAFANHKIKPLEYLGNAGWLPADKNETAKKAWEDEKKALADLEAQKADLVKKAASAAAGAAAPAGGSPNPTPTPSPSPAAASHGKAAPDPFAKLDEEIKKKTNHVRRMSYEHYDTYINYSPSTPNPKNYGKIFWHWYGVASLTPEQAKHAKGFTDFPGLSFPARKPVLDTTAIYEDVFGRFPVVQSIFEPGPGYFVGALPRGANSWYPTWDQRYYLPPDTLDQVAYGALSSGLSSETGLALNDAIFAIRLDTNDTLSFSFRDSGDGFKVAECSLAAYTGIGGDYHPERVGAARFPNKFLLLYLAFPKGQSRVSALSQFATAPNFDEFVTILAFIAQAAVDAQARGNGAESDPLAAYRVWKRSKSAALPSTFGAVSQGIAAAGSDFAERYLKNHPSLLSGGQSLQLK